MPKRISPSGGSWHFVNSLGSPTRMNPTTSVHSMTHFFSNEKGSGLGTTAVYDYAFGHGKPWVFDPPLLHSEVDQELLFEV